MTAFVDLKRKWHRVRAKPTACVSAIDRKEMLTFILDMSFLIVGQRLGEELFISYRHGETKVR